VDLLPHQMYIAGEVASRLVPRVLLADEVGLGKTIEAGLILHRLHLTGRADRILVLVPEALVHQWFVEMLRRFNLLFSLFDEERCESIEQHDPGVNPFLDSQIVICSTAFLAGNSARAARRSAQDGTCWWWTRRITSHGPPRRRARSTRSSRSWREARAALLLLTATPQQLGPEGHFRAAASARSGSLRLTR
jgi:ATP-dependent helicase HepA